MTDAVQAQIGEGIERRSPRRRVLMTALVTYADLGVSFRCAIRDRSDTGARLKLPNGMVVPPQFWMIDVATGIAYDSTAVWRRYPDVGVAFGAATDLKTMGANNQQRRLRALWMAVAPTR